MATSIEKDETLKIKFKSFESNLKLLERNGNETKVEIEEEAKCVAQEKNT